MGILISAKLEDKLKKEGWTWSWHSHPGDSDIHLNASGIPGDRRFIGLLNQEKSMIVNALGRRSIFDMEDNYHITPALLKEIKAVFDRNDHTDLLMKAKP